MGHIVFDISLGIHYFNVRLYEVVFADGVNAVCQMYIYGM